MRAMLVALVAFAALVVPLRAQVLLSIVWEQPIGSPPIAETYLYRAYLDGASGVILQGVLCRPSGVITECSAPLPTPTNGDHTLFLTAANANGESERSSTLRFTYPPSETPPPPVVGTPVAPQNLWIIKRIGEGL